MTNEQARPLGERMTATIPARRHDAALRDGKAVVVDLLLGHAICECRSLVNAAAIARRIDEREDLAFVLRDLVYAIDASATSPRTAAALDSARALLVRVWT